MKVDVLKNQLVELVNELNSQLGSEIIKLNSDFRATDSASYFAA